MKASSFLEVSALAQDFRVTVVNAGNEKENYINEEGSIGNVSLTVGHHH
jgi:hypothetical protein